MSESLSTEVLVVGWGKAGKTLAGALGRSGRSVTLVERSAQMIGGTCINIACVPTKALVHQAAALRDGIWTHPSTTEALNEVLGTPRE